MDEIEIAATNIRSLEKALKAARVSLWDRFFLAALPSALHHGKVTGVAAAAEIADEALRVRDAREAAEYSKPEDVADALRVERGVVSVLAGLLGEALDVMNTVVPDSDDERWLLATLVTRCEDALLAVKRAQLKRDAKGEA